MSPTAGPRARPTMRDVAAVAGVSFKTVSRVVNNEPGVSEAVRREVAGAIETLGYRHDRGASNLRRGDRRTGLVGALLQDVGNDFSAALLRSVSDAAHDRGAAVLAASLDEEADRERALVGDLVSRRVDGLLLMPATQDQSYLARDVADGMPVVVIDRPPVGLDADSVTVDNAAGAATAVHHLLSLGHRRIGVLGDLDEIATAHARREGAEAALREGGASAAELVAAGLRSDAQGRAALGAMLDLADPPTAVVALRNVLTEAAARELRARGLQHQVALVGFDDLPMADLVDPGLTVVAQDVDTMGTEAARLLFARLDGHDGPPEQVVVATSLVARGSGEIPAR
jgi:LacI family transcriptional regulator